MNTITRRMTTSTLAAALLAPLASAQTDNPIDDERAEEREAWSLQFTPAVSGGSTFGADLDGGGRVTVRRAGWSLDLSRQVSDRFILGLGVENDYSTYTFKAPAALGGPSDPFRTLIQLGFTPSVTYLAGRRTSFTAGGIIGLAGESGADLSESVRGGGFISFRRTPNENFTWGMGVAILSRFEDSDLRIIPLPGLDWRASDTLRIFTERAGVNVENRIAEDWFVTFKARWEPREYRLRDDPNALLPSGAARDDSVLLGVELAWRPRPLLEAALELGAVVYQNFELLDSAGVKVFDDNTDPVGFIAGRFTMRF